MAFSKKEFTLRQKKIFLKILSYILNIEDTPSERKTEYLRLQAMELNVDLDKAVPKKALKPADIVKDLAAFDDIRAKRYILREMIILAIADHELSDKEIKTIYEIGLLSGLKQEKIDDFFLWAAEGVEWQLNGLRLVEEDL